MSIKRLLTLLFAIVVVIIGIGNGVKGRFNGAFFNANYFTAHVDTSYNNVKDVFVRGGYSSVINGFITYRENSIRYCSSQPIEEGIYKFKGNLSLVVPQKVKRTQHKDNGRYEVNGGVSGCYVNYDTKNNVTTVEIYCDDSFVITLGKGDNSAFRDFEFELLSYTPYEDNDLYNVKNQAINPCEINSQIVKYYAPTMVLAEDGTIIIAAYCENKDGRRTILNSVSDDGGKSWKTNWNSGIHSMAWDRYNHRLCGVKSGISYVSYDYGMTWAKIGSYNSTYVTEEIKTLCRQYGKDEMESYTKDSKIQRFSFMASSAHTSNSGIQLENGVICIPMQMKIRKREAGKDDNGNWIVDADGYCKPVNGETVGYEKVVAYVLYSKDFGVTWEQSPTTSPDLICEETCITEILPNQVCMNSRGGTEYFWSNCPSERRVHIQKTPVADRESFMIDEWVSDWGTRPTNTIEDALVNADIEKVQHYSPKGAKEKDMTFWMFCNICNPGSFARKGLMLRLSSDGRNWYNVGYLTPSNKLIGGYCEMAADTSHIYIVYEGNRDTDPLSFVKLDEYMLNDILAAYEASKKDVIEDK